MTIQICKHFIVMEPVGVAPCFYAMGITYSLLYYQAHNSCYLQPRILSPTTFSIALKLVRCIGVAPTSPAIGPAFSLLN